MLLPGDRVRLVEKSDMPDLVWSTLSRGVIGTVLGFNPDDIYDGAYPVRWDYPIIGGHTCGGRCEFGHGSHVNARYLRVIGHVSPITDKDLEAILTF